MPTSALADHSALSADLDGLAAQLRQSTATIHVARDRSPTGLGAAIVWSADGLLLTNAHVVHGSVHTATLPDGRSLPARLLARDRTTDLAALQVDPGDHPLTPATLGHPATLRPGTLVVAFGHPLGVSNALSIGVLNATPATDDGHHRGLHAADLLRADIRLAPGNSGGPLADASGRVLGVNTLIANGLGYAVSVDRARRFVAALAPRPRLGLTVRSVRVRQRDGATTDDAALLVLAVAPGLPADRAGILAGDVLFTLDDHTLRRPDDLLAALGTDGMARPHTLAVGRGGRRSVRALDLSDFASHTSRAA